MRFLPFALTCPKPPAFGNPLDVAVRRPVMILNHCRWRSDIIILLHYSPTSLIPTTNDFYHQESRLRGQLLNASKSGIDSVEYENALCSVLKELHELVSQPMA